jgi:TorA maturation chaperone TorD
VSGWKRIPPDRVLAVEAATGIPRTALRPDLYVEAELAPPAGLGPAGLDPAVLDPAVLDPAVLDEVSAARADLYAMLASLLWQPPDAALLARLARPTGIPGDLGQARDALARAAGGTDAASVEREHFNLFTGVSGGDLLPYASYYLTGFVHERPLAEVRDDLHRLGLVRAAGVFEPEDHIAFLVETMAGLIRSAEAPAIDDATFFVRHLQPWAGRFFTDLERAEQARFYRPLATLGRIMMEIETAAALLPV